MVMLLTDMRSVYIGRAGFKGGGVGSGDHFWIS